jgi:hypothetical protein
MDGELLVIRAYHPHQEVFSAGHHLGHGPTGQVKGGEAWDAEIGGQQGLPGQGLVQLVGGTPDGITLRHGSAIPSAWSRPPRS